MSNKILRQQNLQETLRLLDELYDGEICDPNVIMLKYLEIYNKFLEKIDLINSSKVKNLNIDEKMKVDIKSAELIKRCPNAYLMQSPVDNDEKKEEEEVIEIEEENDEPEDIFSILEQLENANAIDDFENLSSEKKTVTNQIVSSKKVCFACNAVNTLIEDLTTSSLICTNCGVENETLLDQGPEWRQYNNDDSRGEGMNRCSCPSNPYSPKTSMGTIMVGLGSSHLKRKQKWGTMVYKERSDNTVFELINNVCTNNNVPKIIADTASFLYKKISDSKHSRGTNEGKKIIIRGRNRTSIIAACVFKACQQHKLPKSMEEIGSMFGLDDKKVSKGKKQFDKIIKNSKNTDIFIEQLKSVTPEDYIRKYCPKLHINQGDIELAVTIVNNCIRMKLASDHNSQAIAAGVVILMANYVSLNLDKKEVIKIFKTSDVTVTKIYNKIEKYVEGLASDEATEYLIKTFKING